MSSADLATAPAEDDGGRPADRGAPSPSAFRTLLALAWPLVVSNSFTTVQVFIDRLFLSWYDVDTSTAAILANTLFWLPYALLFPTAGYVATFAAQYTGAGRPERVGPAVWQGIYFSLSAGVGMLGLIPLAGPIFRLVDHAPVIQALEVQFFRCLCWLALPGLLTATVSAF